MALFKYFKVDKRVKEDNSLGNSDAVLPSSSGSLTQTIPASRIDAINDDVVKPVVETIMDKGQRQREARMRNFLQMRRQG